MRRRGRKAYIRSVYFLPSLATLGNAVCGFGSMYVAGLIPVPTADIADPWTRMLAAHAFTAAAYLIFLAMLFDALDGRLARFARHTTDFGGQLDSLADAISFGAAPAFLALQVFRHQGPAFVPPSISRFIWAIGAFYMSCALMRLARFNVSNEHGEQHHFSFLGLPSPGAAGTVAGMVLMQQDLFHSAYSIAGHLSTVCVYLLPPLVLLTGLLMISMVRYPHLVNRYLRGRRSITRLVVVLAFGLLLVVAHIYTIAIGTLIYVLVPLLHTFYLRLRRKQRLAVD